MLVKAPKGTKDLLPNESFKWQYIETVFKSLSSKFGFKEIRTPIFEHTELFLRGVGETTDIVEKQMYSFQDYGKRNITLKPEGTASSVRSFIENKLYAQTQPTKLSYITPCFRYEKPQTGRLREFHQLGVEVFGADSALADAEVIFLATEFFSRLGVKNLELKINSIGCEVCRPTYKEALLDFFKPKYDELCDTCKIRYEKNPMRIIDCKSKTCQELAKGAPRPIEFLCDTCKTHFSDLKAYLEGLGINYTLDPDIVRGLDYYTKTAFEIVSQDIGAQGTVCGGGRYDHLVESIDGPETPGVGFAIGQERLVLIMENQGLSFGSPPTLEYFILPMNEATMNMGLSVLKTLRDAGISAELDLMQRNVKGQFKYADKRQAQNVIIIGEEELEKNLVSVKNMESGEQRMISIEALIEKRRAY